MQLCWLNDLCFNHNLLLIFPSKLLLKFATMLLFTLNIMSISCLCSNSDKLISKNKIAITETSYKIKCNKEPNQTV